jgi:hypothetical protein
MIERNEEIVFSDFLTPVPETLSREPKSEANRLEHGPVAVGPQDAIPKNDGIRFHDGYLVFDTKIRFVSFV